MADIADLVMRVRSEEADTASERLDDLAASAGRAEKAASQTAAGYSRLEREARQMNAALKQQEAVQQTVARGTRLNANEMLNLSRQISDIGVMLASGQNPFMTLIQQGPQVADIFQTAAQRGVGFRAALAGVLATAAPVLAVLAPIVLAVGAIGSAFAIAAKEINDGNRDLIKTLGLTKDQLKKVGEEGITMGDVLKGTWRAAAKALGEAFGPEIKAVRSAFREWYDELVANTVKEIKAIVGGFVGAFEAIKATWRMFPAAIGDGVIMGVNATLKAVESMVNGAIGLLNKLIGGANGLAEKVGLSLKIPTLNLVDVPELQNRYAGQMAKAGQVAGEAFAGGFARGGAMVDKAFAAITRETLAAWRERVMKEAGEAKAARKGPAAPRDMNDERGAQMDQQLAQARAAELQAQLALVTDIKERARIENQILDQQVLAKQAAIEKQREDIAHAFLKKQITEATALELYRQLEQVAAIEANTVALQRQRIERDKEVALIQQKAARETSGLENEIAVLRSQSDLAKWGFQRSRIAEEILKREHEIERIKLQEALASAQAAKDQDAIAKARAAIAAAEQRQRNERERQAQESRFPLLDVFEEVAGEAATSIRRVADALDRNDFVGAFRGLYDAIKKAQAAFKEGSTASKIASVAGIASAAGDAIGGKAGGILSGAASGAALGLQIGGPIGAAAGAVLGGVIGAINSDRQKKEEQRARNEAKIQAELQRVSDLANARRQLELDLVEASGDSFEALTARRKAELEAMDASLRALQQQVWAEQDRVARLNTARSLEVQLLEAQGKATEAVAVQRAFELKQMDPALRALQQAVWVVQDVKANADKLIAEAQGKVREARENLINAYQREVGAIKATQDRFRGLMETFKAARLSLEQDNSTGGGYAIAAAEFRRLAALPAGAEERLAQLPAAVQRFVEASKQESPSSLALARDMAEARAALLASEQYALDQVVAGDRQLEALNLLMDAQDGVIDGIANLGTTTLVMSGGVFQTAANVLTVREAVLGVDAAIANLAAVEAAQGKLVTEAVGAALTELAKVQAANQPSPTPAGPREFDPNGYLAKNPDVMAEYARHTTDKDRAYLASLGIRTAQDFALWHWNGGGKNDGRAFARGGMHMGGLRLVGEEGPELEVTGPSRIYSAEQTRQLLASGNDNSVLIGTLQRQNTLLEEQNLLLRGMDRRETLRDIQGVFVRGEAPGDAVVTTEAA